MVLAKCFRTGASAAVGTMRARSVIFTHVIRTDPGILPILAEDVADGLDARNPVAADVAPDHHTFAIRGEERDVAVIGLRDARRSGDVPQHRGPFLDDRRQAVSQDFERDGIDHARLSGKEMTTLPKPSTVTS